MGRVEELLLEAWAELSSDDELLEDESVVPDEVLLEDAVCVGPSSEIPPV